VNSEHRRQEKKKEIVLLISIVTLLVWNRGSSVSIATDYKLDGRVSIPGSVKRFLSVPHHPHRLWGRPSLLSNWYRDLSGDKAAGHEASYSPPFSAEVKNGGAIPLLSPHLFMA
jgi:hypothetical protein